MIPQQLSLLWAAAIALGLALLALAGVVSPWFFLVALTAGVAGSYYLWSRSTARSTARSHAPTAPSATDVPLALIDEVRDVISPVACYRTGEHYVIEGTLLREADAAYDALRGRFAARGLEPLLQETAAGRAALVLSPAEAAGAPAQRAGRPWLSLALFAATLLTTTWAGAAAQGVDVVEQPAGLAAGLPYALALMLILGTHELGHYFTARRYGMDVSLPYFIPVPFALGTFGAFIRMKSLARDRRAMFDVAVAGPLAGLAVALPALLVGLRYSAVVPEAASAPMLMGGTDVGSSLLYALLAKAALGEAVLQGHRLILHPVAFAGWLGLFVTALNLIPVGQLDGGHLVHALFGGRVARRVGVIALSALVLLGVFVWHGLLFWALLIFLMAGTSDVPPRNDVSRVGRRRLVLGAAAFALLLLILIPLPHALYGAFGIHCPYAPPLHLI